MSAEKKITKEDTWKSEELMKHIQSLDGENRRRERTKREETHRKLRSGESLDRRHREPERDERREREKPRERDREEERRRRDERERRKERERDGERRGSERRGEEGERENRDREKERQRERYKDRDREREGEPGREKEREKHRDRERDREKERARDIDRDRERSERHKDREKKEREKDKEWNRDRDRDKEKDRYKDRERDEKYRDREREKDREKEKDRERRRAEKERRREIGEEKYREKDKEREREKRERHSEHSGHTDREERRERRRREKEYNEATERHHSDPQETERDRRHRDEENGRLRDKEERDKRKEKRHEESKKGSSDHRHDKYDSRLRNSDQEVSAKRPELSWRANDAELSDPEIPMENEDNKDNNKGDEEYENEEYEEDFEDYEEDFEEMEEEEEDEEKGEEGEVRDVEGERDGRRELSPRRRKEIEAIQRAMQRENELVSSAHSRPPTSKAEPTQKVVADSESHTKKGRTHGRVIDFTAARQREVSQQAADKQKKRSAELLRLIDLDYSVTMCLLDLPPVSEYDMYIKSFGMANTKQAYVQCNEDNTDRDTQTEETDTVDKWTQHPPESNTACGGPKASQDTSDESVARINIDSKRLTTFLRSAAQVMAVLLEENRAENRNSVKQLHSQTDSLSFSEGCLHLNTKLPFLQGRQVTLLHFSQVQTHTLLSVHSPCSGSSDEQLESKTLICVWNIWEPSAPQRILIYEAEVRCCCFSPGKATLVFAGTAVGSVVLWDLREHSGSHSSLSAGGEDFTLRYPTFSTDAVLAGAGHFSSVVSVEPVVVNVESGIRGSFLEDQEESLGLLFQLGSLDENGLLNLWVVTELPKTDDSGSQTDLGLRPGGKVKLLHSSSIQTSDSSTHHGVTGVTPLLSLLLKFLPSDSNHYFIGTNMGVVRRGTRHGLRAVPKLYRPEDGERPADITALDFCPSGEPFFLVGCSDGTVRLHSVLREEPVSEWSTGSGDVPVLSVLWSRTRPSVFCVLDAASVLHIWDLAEKDMCPVITESFHTDRVNAMAVFGEAARQNRYSGMALAKQSGRLEIHFLKPSLTVPQPSDSERLHLLAQDNI